ncbi:MAG: glycosyltransferase family 4 protein [Acidimicrobiales bacterium]
MNAPLETARPLRIVQVCADRGIAPGATKGASQHLRGIAAGLVALGHQVVTVAGRRAEGPFPVPVQPLDHLDGFVADADVVYERSSLGHTDGLDAARRHGAAFVLEVNAPLVDEAMRHRPDTVDAGHAAAEARLLAEADLVVVVSDVLAQWASARRDGPVVVVRNGFEPAWFAEAARPAETETLVFLGHPKPWHGADRLLRLLVDLAAHGHHPHLLVIGGGSGADALRDAAIRSGVGDRVEITGALAPDAASALVSRGAIGLAPYPPQDGFYFCPLKVLDYLAAGVPVVSTDQGDVPRLVADAGVIVPADDDEALAAAVAGLLDDPDRRARLGAAGRTRAHASLTWDHAAEATVAAIETMLVTGAHRG